MHLATLSNFCTMGDVMSSLMPAQKPASFDDGCLQDPDLFVSVRNAVHKLTSESPVSISVGTIGNPLELALRVADVLESINMRVLLISPRVRPAKRDFSVLWNGLGDMPPADAFDVVIEMEQSVYERNATTHSLVVATIPLSVTSAWV
jgi:hypothetical protein